MRPYSLLCFLFVALLLILSSTALLGCAEETVVGKNNKLSIPASKTERDVLVSSLRQRIQERLRRQHTEQSCANVESGSGDPEGRRGTASSIDDAARVELPEPPHALGVHTPCRKFGKGCPEVYIHFLHDYLASLPTPPIVGNRCEGGQPMRAAMAESEAEATEKTAEPDKDSSGSARKGAGPQLTPSLPFPIAPEWSAAEITHLENIQQYVNVLERSLGSVCLPSAAAAATKETVSALVAANRRDRSYNISEVVRPPSRFHCGRYTIQTWLASAFVASHPWVMVMWSWLAWRLLPCAALVALVVWTLTGEPLTQEEESYITSTLDETASHQAQPQAGESTLPTEGASTPTRTLASTLLEGAANKVSALTAVAAADGTADTPPDVAADDPLGAELTGAESRHREAVNVAILETYHQQETLSIFLKVRVALCIASLVILLWALNSVCWYWRVLLFPSAAPSKLTSSRPSSSFASPSSLLRFFSCDSSDQTGRGTGDLTEQTSGTDSTAHASMDESSNAGSVIRRIARYLTPMRELPASLLWRVSRIAASRVVPSWLQHYGGFLLGLSFLFGLFVVVLKDLMDAWNELLLSNHRNAARRRKLLSSPTM